MYILGLWSLLHLANAGDCPTGKIVKHGKVRIEKLNEASGMVATDTWLWFHNDSGDGPTLYASSMEGEGRAEITIEGAFARDWEAMTPFSENDRNYFLIGDTGDNKERLDVATFYVIEKPSSNTVTPVLYSFTATYAELGAKDVEAFVVDPKSKELLVITKGRDGIHHYLLGAFPLPSSIDLTQTSQAQKFSAPHIALREIHSAPFAQLPLDRSEQSRLITDATIDPTGEWLIVRNYLSARVYRKQAEETWTEAFQQKPCKLPLPMQQQGETLAFSPNGTSVWTLSEGSSQMLYEIQLTFPEGSRQP